jgi:hypothetical protein
MQKKGKQKFNNQFVETECENQLLLHLWKSTCFKSDWFIKKKNWYPTTFLARKKKKGKKN